MRVSLDKVESLCGQRELNIGGLLREAGVSRNAFYSLSRKDSVLPRSLIRIAEALDVSPSALLDESPTPTERIKKIAAESKLIAERHKDIDRDTARHTLILLHEKPLDRLRRALRRGRSFDLR
jgi:hypothetical protein